LRLVLDPAAFAELREAAKFYEESRKGLGREFLEGVETAFDSIARHPKLWRKLRGRFRRCLVHRFPYGIIYAVEDDIVPQNRRRHNHRGHRERRVGEARSPARTLSCLCALCGSMSGLGSSMSRQ
jgi:plasmid stabilization system protein ParE